MVVYLAPQELFVLLAQSRRPPRWLPLRASPHRHALWALEGPIHKCKNLLDRLSGIDYKRGTRGRISAYGVGSHSKRAPSSCVSVHSGESRRASETSEVVECW